MRFIAVPGVFLASDVAIEQGLVLKFVPAKTPGEGVFRPDYLATYFEARTLQHVLKLALRGERLRDFWNGIFVGESLGRILRASESVQVIESDHVKIEIFLLKSASSARRSSPGVQGELVVRDD